MHDQNPETCARLGCILAAINLENVDTQTYEIEETTLRVRYKKTYGVPLP